MKQLLVAHNLWRSHVSPYYRYLLVYQIIYKNALKNVHPKKDIKMHTLIVYLFFIISYNNKMTEIK